jgi:hypothetical protein
MASVIIISFVLVIPIGDVAVVLFAFPAGLIIGYYANQRSGRTGGRWPRILANASWAALVTGLTSAVLLLGIKAIFFNADSGYRDPALGGPIECSSGPDCVWKRYIDAGYGADLEALGVTDVDSFTSYYWGEQLSTVGSIVLVTLAGGLLGGVAYRLTNRTKPAT